jgi:aromatic ring-opening dioxygenase LigB subunit
MLVSAYMLPHGTDIIPGIKEPYGEGFRPLHLAMEQAGKTLAAENPDLVIMLVPHGYTLPEQHVVYLHERYLGLLYDASNPDVFGAVQMADIWRGDRAAAEQVLAAMQAKHIPASGLIQGGPPFALTLAWSETVPLRYLLKDCAPRVVIISLPRTRYDKMLAIQPDLAALGDVLYEFAAASEQRVSIVISADLAHTHDAGGPYGFHKAAAKLDDHVDYWVRSPKRERLNQMLALQTDGKACGMAGMCVLQVILDRAHLKATTHTYAAPTYYGMMVAHWA